MALASVLVVDDDEGIRRALRRSLERLDILIHLAEGSSRGFEILRRDPVDIVISDNAMPGMSGVAFLRVVRQTWPSVVRIMLTGAATLETAIAAINDDEIFRFLLKPWDEQELKMTILLACERIKRTPHAP